MNGVGGRIAMASAGSGKTYALTSRLIGLLAVGEEPRSILAATFTRKAAGEILERVIKRLADAAGDADELAALNVAMRAALGPVAVEMDSAGAERLLAKLVADIDQVGVLTLDAFFQRLASGFALDLGVPPGWRVASDEADARLRREAIGLALRDRDLHSTVKLLRQLQRDSFGRSVLDALLRTADQFYNAWVETEACPGVWEVARPQAQPLSKEERETLAERILGADVPRTQAGGEVKHWANARKAIAECVGRGAWSDIPSIGLVQKRVAGEEKFAGKPIEGDWPVLLDSVAAAARVSVLQTLHEQNVATRELMGSFDGAYRGLKARTGLARFEDVPRLLLGLEWAGLLDHVYYRLDTRYRHVLLDEFQDTSVAQMRLLEPLVDEIMQDGSGERSVFIVGDVKQSLYGWRNAEPELMPAVSDAYPSLERTPLRKSWRSSPVVIGAVNRVFGVVGEMECLSDSGAPARWAERWDEHKAHFDAMPGVVRLIEAPAPEVEGRVTSADHEAEVDAVAAERVSAICAESPGATVGVLVRTNGRVRPLVERLRAAGVDASEEGGSPLLEDPAVMAAVSVLGLIDHPGDSARLFHVATGPMGEAAGITDPQDVIAAAPRLVGLRRALVEDGYAAVLGRWMRRAAGSFSAASIARFGQLVELAAEFDASDEDGVRLRAARFVEWVRQRKVEKPASSRVRVMNIHKSKGLEFDAVVLPELDGRWEVRDAVIVRRPDALGEPDAATVRPNKDVAAMDAELGSIVGWQRDRAVMDGLCALYVAMTRAKRRLEMIVQAEGEGASVTPARVLRAGLGAGDFGTLGEAAVLFEESVGRWDEGLGGAAKREAREVELVRGSFAQGGSLLRAERLSPSGLADSARPIFAASGSGSGARRGTAVHACFERVGWLDEGEPDREELIAAAIGAGASDAEADGIAGEVLGWIGQPEIRGALCRQRYSVPSGGSLELLREHRFATRLRVGGNEALLSGQIDRVVVVRDAEGRAVDCEVLDFKTDGLVGDSGAFVRSKVAAYGDQLRAYAAAAGLFGVGAGSVSASLVLLEAGVVARVETSV